jgi:Family of unknown function (DUF5924)
MLDPNLAVKPETAGSSHPLISWLRLHQEKLWWLHSFYALLLGVGFMWLGERNFAYLRIAVFHIGFIWLSSFMLPRLLKQSRLSDRWASRLRLVVNFFNKNLYQQMLFFVLPIYYASATVDSLNIFFVVLVGASALLSTADIVYDRHLSVKRNLNAAFFAFNLFALINVMLPIVWSVSNTVTTRLGGTLAFLGFLTLGYSTAQSSIRRLGDLLAVALLILGLVELGRPFLPPAPLRIAAVEVGREFERESLQVVSPLNSLSPPGPLRLYGLTAIKAPLGLREKLQHRWYENGKLICASPFYNIVGGREEGFRLWTSCVLSEIPSKTTLRLDLKTEGGQLIGRTELRPPT